MKDNTFLVLDGGDMAGKTTVINYLKQRIENLGNDVITTREPGGTPAAEEIRMMLLRDWTEPLTNLAELNLFFAARDIHVNNVILPKTREGKFVITDRFDSATYAYQLHGRQYSLVRLKDLFFAQRKLILENCTPFYIIFEISSQERQRRKALAEGREINHFDLQNDEFHNRVSMGFRDFTSQLPNNQYKFVDADASKEELRERVWEIVSERFKF